MPEDITPDPALEAGQSGDDDQRPEWLPEKFKSPEDLAKSYTELERKLTEEGENRSNLEAQLGDLYEQFESSQQAAQQAQRPAYDPSTDPTLLAYEQAMENGDYRAALAIQAGLMQTIVQQQTPAQPQENPRDYEAWAFVAEQTAIQQVGGADEWAQYKDQVLAEAKAENFDNLSAQQAGQRLARIWKMAKADDVLNNQQTVAQQQAEAERQRKLDAQSISGSGGHPPAPTKDEQTVSSIIKAAKEGTYSALTSG